MKWKQHKIECLYPVVLVILPLIVFYPVFTHDFLYMWDDKWQVLNGYTFGGVSWKNIYSIFSEYPMGQYSPLNQLVYSFLYIQFGPNATVFHAANLVWHIGCVLLVYRSVGLLLQLRLQKRKALLIAFTTALLMAVHPVQVECVAWISASKVLTFSFFFLLGLTFYLHYIRTEKPFYYLLCVLAFICSFLCKEQALVFPAILLLIDWFAGRNMRKTLLWLEKIPICMLAVCFVVITLDSYVIPLGQVFIGQNAYPFVHRMVFAGYSLTEYLTKLVFPVNLMYMYPYPMQAGESLPVRFWIYLPVLFVLAGAVWYNRKKTVFLFGSIFFVLQLFLSLHIIPLPRFTILADRYLYLAAIGLFLAVTYRFAHWPGKFSLSGKTVWILFAVVALYFSGYSNYRCRTWKNDATLKKEVVTLLNERENKEEGATK